MTWNNDMSAAPFILVPNVFTDLELDEIGYRAFQQGIIWERGIEAHERICAKATTPPQEPDNAE